MYVITFTKDLPSGFKEVMVDTSSDNIEELLDNMTNLYNSVNYPELVIGEDAFHNNRASRKCYHSYSYIIDRYNVANFEFTIEKAHHLKG